MADTGRNESGPSNDQILDWMRKYQTQKRRCSEENGVLRNLVKQAKGEGVHIKVMLAECEAQKMPLDERIAELRERIRYAALRAPDQFTAETLFDGWSPRITEKSKQEDDIWDAEESGYKAGRYGVPVDDCPYLVGGELHQAWMSWRMKGQEAIAKEMGPNQTVASTARSRPKRNGHAEPAQEALPGTPEPVRAAPKKKTKGPGRGGTRRGAGRRKRAAVEAPASVN